MENKTKPKDKTQIAGDSEPYDLTVASRELEAFRSSVKQVEKKFRAAKEAKT
jgi:hypothetical protein